MEEDNETLNSFGKKVESQIQQASPWNVKILIDFPKELYNQFREYSRQEANNCYWLAIQQLLEHKKYSSILTTNTIREAMILEQIQLLQDQINELRSQISSNKEEQNKPKEFKTFGRTE